MAWTSGALSTSNQYIKYTITIAQNSQSITNNTSNVTVSVRFYRTNTGYTTYGSGTVYCKINGTTYSASVDSSDKITNSGIILFSKTLNISHNSDGTKTLATSAWIDHSQVTSSEQSYSHALTTIPRKSTLTVANGTLDTEQTLTVTTKSSSFKHTITYSCGSASGTICSKSASTSIKFTPPLSLASQNTTGGSVSIKYIITTYNGSTSIGSNSYTKTCTIPTNDETRPDCSITVTDATGYADKYGTFVQNQSKFKIEVTASGKFGATIASYAVTANNTTYSTASVTTGVIKAAGSQGVAVVVKDSRGKSKSAGVSVAPLRYSYPVVSKLNVKRCDADGTENDKGEYIQVTFGATVTSLNDKNSATYTLQFKKSADTEYTSEVLTDYSNVYSVTDATYIFAADSGSSYDVQMVVSDDFKSVTEETSASTGFSMMHFSAGGTGMGIGKIAEEENLLDVGVPLKLREGIVSNLLWSGEWWMQATQTAELSEPIDKQPNGIVLVFSRYSDSTARNYNWNCFFIPKMQIAMCDGLGHQFLMSTDGTFSAMASKYLYISNESIKGRDQNKLSGTNNGITYDNSAFVLRYVIGV